MTSGDFTIEVFFSLKYKITVVADTYIRSEQGGRIKKINPDLQSTEERLKQWEGTAQVVTET